MIDSRSQAPDSIAEKSNPTEPEVVVAIVSYRSSEDVCACLRSLASSEYGPFSIAVCENGGPEAFEQLCEAVETLPAILEVQQGRHPARARRIATGFLGGSSQRIMLVEAADNFGFAGGNNILIELVRAEKWEYVWILNPDTVVDRRALSALVARAKAGRFGVVGSRVVSQLSGRIQAYGGRWRAALGRAQNIGLGADGNEIPDTAAIERRMSYVLGMSMLVSRGYIDEVGVMDERYFLYCEEVDWCLRRGRHALGYAHDSIVRHAQGATTGARGGRRNKSELSVYLNERNSMILTRTFYPRRLPVAAVSSLLLLGQYLLAGSLRNFRAGFAGWRAGLAGEVGPPPRVLSRHAFTR